MTKFEFFMGFYGLLLGLSVAELLTGFGNLLRQRERPKWGMLTPLAGLAVFVMIISAFLDAWASMQDISINLRGLFTPIAIAMSYFFAALMVVPRDATEWADLDAYFLARRKLIFAPTLIPIVLTIFVLERPHWAEFGGPTMTYVVVNALLFVLQALPIVTARPRVIKVALILFLAIMVEIYFTELSIADQVNWLLGHPLQGGRGPAAASAS